MENKQGINISTNIELITVDKNTRLIKEKSVFHNTLTYVGRKKVTELLMDGMSSVSFSKIAIGTDNTPADKSDTELGNFYSEANAVMSYVNDYIAKFSQEFSFTELVTIWEVGIFDSDGVMLNHGISDIGMLVNEDVPMIVNLFISVSEVEEE